MVRPFSDIDEFAFLEPRQVSPFAKPKLRHGKVRIATPSSRTNGAEG
jgi:hypothetical protein